VAAGGEFDAFRQRYHELLRERYDDRSSRLSWSADELTRHQRAALRHLLSYARERSPFYARRLAGIDPETFELEDLPRLPMLTKAEMMSDLDDVFTDRRLSRAVVEESVRATAHDPVLIRDSYLAQVSGGSSYHRGLFLLDLDNIVDGALAVLRATNPGATAQARDGQARIAMVAAGSPLHGTGLVPALNPPAVGPAAIYSVPASLPMREIVHSLNDIDPHVLSGYPSVLAQLASERLAGRLHAHPLRIQATGEMLTPGLRRSIKAGFDAPIIDVFGCSEGLLGVSGGDSDVFRFNSDMFLVEPIDERGCPTRPGSVSAAVLLTSLTNRVQPLIRYRLGDPMVHIQAGGSAMFEAKVVGRELPLFWYAGVPLHPTAVSSLLLERSDVLDYQIFQTPDGVEIALVSAGRLDVEDVRDSAARALTSAGLAQPVVVVRQVGGLARLYGSGKVRRFVPLPAS
jgi:phenylacetate-coenzyme A ligase PaaK-like adenylate-forming protein